MISLSLLLLISTSAALIAEDVPISTTPKFIVSKQGNIYYTRFNSNSSNPAYSPLALVGKIPGITSGQFLPVSLYSADDDYISQNSKDTNLFYDINGYNIYYISTTFGMPIISSELSIPTIPRLLGSGNLFYYEIKNGYAEFILGSKFFPTVYQYQVENGIYIYALFNDGPVMTCWTSGDDNVVITFNKIITQISGLYMLTSDYTLYYFNMNTCTGGIISAGPFIQPAPTTIVTTPFTPKFIYHRYDIEELWIMDTIGHAAFTRDGGITWSRVSFPSLTGVISIGEVYNL